MTPESAGRRRSIRDLVLADGSIGFLVGVLLRSWQISVEPGQAIAGLVRYPAWNPELRYQLGTWTLLNQLSALGLGSGLSEAAVSTLLSGIVAAMSFVALALVVYAVSGRPVIALLAPLILIYARGGAAYPGVTYNVALLGGGGYGLFGLVSVLLVLALLACDEPGWAGFVAILTVAVHPALGLWLGAILAIVAITQPRWAIAAIRMHWKLWVPALVIAAISFAVYKAMALPAQSDPKAPEYLSAFIKYWDAHRRRFTFWSAPMAEVLVTVLWGIVLLLTARRNRSGGLQALAVALLAAAALGLGFSACYWMEPGRVPPLLLALMPSRVVNIDLALGLAITLAMLARRPHGDDRLLILALFALIANATIPMIGRVLPDLHFPSWSKESRQWVTVVIELAMLAAVSVRSFTNGARECLTPSEPMTSRTRVLLPVAIAAILCALLFAGWLAGWTPLRDRTNDRFWQTVASRPGMLVTSPGAVFVQARSRRPILLNPYSLDYLPFTAGVGATMETILRDVYGVDLLNPPPHLQRARRGGLLPEDGRLLWERRSPSDWTAMRRRYGVTDVLCDRTWRVQLRRVSSSPELALYEIPQ